MPAPTPLLDLAAIEGRADEWILSSVDRRELAYTLINTDIPALVARVRALELENAELQARAGPPPPPINRPQQAHAYWRAHRTGPNRGDKPCRRCSTLMRDVPGNKQYCAPACQQADAKDGYGRGPYTLGS